MSEVNFSFFMILLLDSILVSNVVLAQYLGICPFLGVSKKLSSALGMGLSVTVVLVLSVAATWPVQHFLLDPAGLGYLQTLVFILIIAALVQMLEIVLKKKAPALHKSLGIYLPLITTNCCVLGVAISCIDRDYGFGTSLVYAAGSGLGFLLAMTLFAGVRYRIDQADVPLYFRGLPSALIAASVMALAFMGFSGVAEGIFG